MAVAFSTVAFALLPAVGIPRNRLKAWSLDRSHRWGFILVSGRIGGARVGLGSSKKTRRRVQRHGLWPKLKQFFNPPDVPVIPAVCIPPGARLLVRDIPAGLQRECGFQKDMGEAVFTQITAAVNTFRDAVRFQNGSEVLLQRFAEGQRVRVLTLASAEERATGPKQQQRVTMRVA